ncbi:S1C family serine protease [Pontiella sulfatireligans]|uniref:Serine protease HhoB n=1 Tax=Pontiella sulfatireligans TaxID=2750658 RepID=A0A6C2UR56_9BACT|nr:trypsin-like peptidase domain-containing protein [Pontiella sulfatireligans]VGO22785.1 Putative serine protease HhoB [Pontiella sulfatireligans]
MKHKWVLIGFCGLMVLSALFSALRRQRAYPVVPRMGSAPETRFAPRQLPIVGSNPARQFSNAIADAVEKVMPSVVVIRTEKIEYQTKRNFYGFTYRVPAQLAGEGSGVIIDERGYVITSRHVIAGAQYVEVVLNDGTKMPAKLIGDDKSTDLAILKIKGEGTGCPAVEFGDSDALRVGEVVIAIGSPFSLQSSVTVGHVSQKGRRFQILPYEDFIQTDAAINEGNSGGPLIDVDGRLIGINAAIRTDAAEKGVGIAFAVPSNLAMVITKSLINKGVHEWPWVGAAFGVVRLDDVPELQVRQVWRDTPAAMAGMLPGDVILAVNDIEVANEYDVYRIIFNHAVGETLRFRVWREKEKQLEFELLLQEFPGLTS